ncbi:regulator RcnB of Ni and Co efflux [Acinetobacter marinus]|uniref:Regulator RcnB of Ni and Co efflux n=1 Tax=Acinetobacter marinus TaxID=281375 RepID=A0A1G6ML64_9GAMM|nr:RcnB family protein [Acinetobacter marinus]SDC56262.1 regulator RcnB of Ni and Co efflux [Acinetobacter marinus]
MNKQISAVLLSLSMLAGSTVAFAAPQGPEQNQHEQHDAKKQNSKQQDSKKQGNDHKAPAQHQTQQKSQPKQSAHKSQPQHQVKKSTKHSDYKRGQKLPKQYRDNHVDYKKHKLPKPGKNQRWVKVDGDYVLISVVTGVIASIILGS